MPLYLRMPLPGPFSYSTRLGGGGRRRRRAASRFSSPAYWLFGIFALELVFWAIAVLVWSVIFLVKFVGELISQSRQRRGRS